MTVKNLERVKLNVLKVNFAFILFQTFFFVPILLIVGLEFIFALSHPTNLLIDLIFWFVLLMSLTTIPLIVLAIIEVRKKKKIKNSRNLACVYCNSKENIAFLGYPSFFNIFLLPICTSHRSKYKQDIGRLYQQEKKTYTVLHFLLFPVNLLIDVIMVIPMTLIYIMVMLMNIPSQLGVVLLIYLTVVPFIFQLLLFIFISIKIYFLLREIKKDTQIPPH